jgi:predicted transcriptional regulator
MLLASHSGGRRAVLSRQLNLRLSPSVRDKLEALAFLRRTTATALAREVVEDFIELHRAEPGLEDALRGLAKHDTAEAAQADVRSLESARRPTVPE